MAILDDLVPTPLHAFSPETLSDLKASGRCESLFFEFKSEWKPDDVTRCVCAFANASGGFLLFGASQRGDGCIDGFPGLPAGTEYETLAKDRIVGHISPLPAWDARTIASPEHPDRVVLVVRIAASDRTPHVTSNGRIYVRTPSACDPVTDRATVNLLYARGGQGSRYLTARRQELREIPWTEERPSGGSWDLLVGAVPSPAVPELYRVFVTERGFETAAALFVTRTGRPTPKRALEDGVLLEQGFAELACFSDGAMVYRVISSVEAEPPPAVRPGWVQQMTELLLNAERRLDPPVRQCHLFVDLVGTAGFHLRELDSLGFDRDSSLPLRGDWRFATETSTDEAAAAMTVQRIVRRLQRAAGERAFEPDTG